MRAAPPPHSIILIYRKPLSSIAYRLQPINKCIVRLNRSLYRNIVGLFEANGTGEGRKRARARGVRFGRPTALTPHQRAEALQRLANGEVQADLARSYGVSQATISRLQA